MQYTHRFYTYQSLHLMVLKCAVILYKTAYILDILKNIKFAIL